MVCLYDLYQLRLDALLGPLTDSVEIAFLVDEDSWEDYLHPLEQTLVLYRDAVGAECLLTERSLAWLQDVHTLYGAINLLTLAVESPTLQTKWMQIAQAHDPIGESDALPQ
jgi:hypothetical protein